MLSAKEGKIAGKRRERGNGTWCVCVVKFWLRWPEKASPRRYLLSNDETSEGASYADK